MGGDFTALLGVGKACVTLWKVIKYTDDPDAIGTQVNLTFLP